MQWFFSFFLPVVVSPSFYSWSHVLLGFSDQEIQGSCSNPFLKQIVFMNPGNSCSSFNSSDFHPFELLQRAHAMLDHVISPLQNGTHCCPGPPMLTNPHPWLSSVPRFPYDYAFCADGPECVGWGFGPTQGPRQAHAGLSPPPRGPVSVTSDQFSLQIHKTLINI